MKIYITGLPSGYEVEHLARLFYPMAPLTLTPPDEDIAMPPSKVPEPLQLLAVGTMTSRKGYDILLRACLANGCHISVDSDAHSTHQLQHGLTALYAMLEEMQFPQELIVNATRENLVQELQLHGKPCAEEIGGILL